MSRALVAVLAALALAGCASSKAPAVGSTTGNEVTDAMTTPLSDLNLVRGDIPAVLVSAQKAPYLLPGDASCGALAGEVRALDGVLGADLDTPATASNPGMIERGSNAAGDAAVGSLRGAAEGVMPFRGWVRKLSGAERYSRDVQAAIAAGTVRRSFLKGVGLAKGCEAPAAPRSTV